MLSIVLTYRGTSCRGRLHTAVAYRHPILYGGHCSSNRSVEAQDYRAWIKSYVCMVYTICKLSVRQSILRRVVSVWCCRVVGTAILTRYSSVRYHYIIFNIACLIAYALSRLWNRISKTFLVFTYLLELLPQTHSWIQLNIIGRPRGWQRLGPACGHWLCRQFHSYHHCVQQPCLDSIRVCARCYRMFSGVCRAINVHRAGAFITQPKPCENL